MDKIFQERFNEFLKKRGKTQKEIAKELNVSEKLLSEYITGKKMMREKMLRGICIYLKVSSDYLLGLSDSPEFKKYFSGRR